jgi:hypothetical protein
MGPPRWDAAEWAQATVRLYWRQHGRCAWCGKPLVNDGVRHHRKRRREGGDRYSNVVLLHDACHAHVHAHPEAARALGVICPLDHDPTDWPWFDGAGVGWLLDDDGLVTRLDRPRSDRV